jgi:hypothetical protein
MSLRKMHQYIVLAYMKAAIHLWQIPSLCVRYLTSVDLDDGDVVLLSISIPCNSVNAFTDDHIRLAIKHVNSG